MPGREAETGALNIFALLVLLLIANGGPILLQALLGGTWAAPIDGGSCWRDGRPLFGPSKTWRGLCAALVASAAAAPLVHQPVALGVAVAALAMAGDLLSSFAKRRFALPPSTTVPGFDQIPEALLPVLVLWQPFDLNIASAVAVVGLFVLLGLLLSAFLHALGLRSQTPSRGAARGARPRRDS